MGEQIRRVMLACACVAGIGVTLAQAESKWPPEPMVEMRIPVEPMPFTGNGNHYLVYELRMTNLSTGPVEIHRLEARDALVGNRAPLAAYEDAELDGVLQHFGNPAVGDRMPTAGASHRQLAAGESVIVFLTVVLDPKTPVPARLMHRLYLADSEASIDGAIVDTRGARLTTIAPPLKGGPWLALSGAGDNTSHHRRQFVVLGGRARMPNRCAIDWKRAKDGAHFSGDGEDNSDYYSYGEPVLAVASGRVVAIHDGIKDNKPGHVGAESFDLTLETIGGNLLVLDLGNGQYAHYMHLQPGSLRVHLNDTVRRGDVIARVGSSGSSFEPHLHFEVTDSAALAYGEGLPYVIDEYQSLDGGAPVRRRRELPLKGTLVEFPR